LIFFWLVFAHDVFKAGKEKGDKAFSSLTKALHYRQTEFYSYENLFSIFFLLFLFSLIITAIQYVFVYCYQFEGLSLVSYDNIKALRYVMLCMVVVAGLVLPFLGPYCGYRYVLKYATNLNEKEKHDKDAMKNEFLRQLDEICDKIK
jgi:magnesium-transporting ATPase (P-type)